jgi:hypothetical protein
MIPGKGIRGILEGESVPDIFILQLIELNAQGALPVRETDEVLQPRSNQSSCARQ